MTTARDLLDSIRDELAHVEQAIRSHRYLELATEEALPALAGEQHWILSGDRRSFAHLAARFPEPPAGDFFLDLAQGEGEALRLLGRLGFEQLDRYEPTPGAHAYTAYVSWLALNGSRADVAVAFLANLAAWGDNCRRLAERLRGRVDVSFFEFFASPPEGFEERALLVADQGLAAGDSPAAARRAARLLQAYELLFWDTLADAL